MYKIEEVPDFFKEWMQYTNVSLSDLEKTINSLKEAAEAPQSVFDIIEGL